MPCSDIVIAIVVVAVPYSVYLIRLFYFDMRVNRYVIVNDLCSHG